MTTETATSHLEKVVIQFGTKSVRGYLETPIWSTIEDVVGKTFPSSIESLDIRLLDSDRVEVIHIGEVKAVFFVNSFNGDPIRKTINFHTGTPIVHGIWMRVEFLDGEVLEGIVYNSIRYLIDPGFFLLPTDPGSNNKLIYVQKKWLVDHRVLGLRKISNEI
jgi:hypothetical protein